MMDPRHAILFESVQIGPKTLPNRFYQVPHASGFGSARPLTQAAFRGIKAEGGWGGVCVEYSPVSADADEEPHVAAYLQDDRDAAALRPTVEAIHRHGALAGVELYHGGNSSKNVTSRHTRIAPSAAAAEIRWGSSAREMDLDDIARVQADFVHAARLARDIGFDIVYVYGAHGYLLTQFLSPWHNLRTDAYGGSLAGRARFALETLEKVRDAIGDDCAIATRFCLDGRSGVKGVRVEEMLRFVQLAEPLVDLFDVTVGSWPEDSGTSRYYPEGHQLSWTSQVREATSKPIVGVGRYTNPDQMAALIASGQFDLIGAARPAIADPFLPRKIAEGRLGDIRECTGSNVCILKEEDFRHVGCIQNPTAGEEYRRSWHPEEVPTTDDPDRAVLVIGAGPAGMECALTLGRRGFAAVHLVEASDDIGGRLTWTRRLPTLGDWGRIIDWRRTQLDRLDNVQVITGRRLDVADVLDYGAGIVVVATGSHWSDGGTQPGTRRPILGSAGSLTPERVMAGDRPGGQRVAVYDCDGYYVAPGIAELLAAEGYEVHLVTPEAVVSPMSDGTLEGDMLRRHLHDVGIAMHTGITLRERRPGSVIGETAYEDPWSLEVDDLVLVTHQVPDDTLYRALAADSERLADAGISALHLIGDARSPRWISEAVFDGHRLARELDLPSPDFPAPLRRDLPV
ncbi:MAG: NAD(P)-binding protein [Actinomycetales bacterium]|nr:NAD(P)-binding protein [Actinomycetales bacterium]